MKLSIITVNLNNHTGLDRTIRSIIEQTFKEYELIVIDGGSDHKSINILREYKPSIAYWVSEPDNGIYHAMNKGIKRAIGEYCYFLNSGDTLAKRNSLLDLFNRELTEDIIQCNMIVTENERIKGIAKGKNKITFTDILGSIVKHQGTLIRRELFAKYGLYNENLKLIADFEFFLKSIGLGNASYRYINHDLAIYDNCGLSNSNPSLIQSEREQVITKYIPSSMLPDFKFLLKYRKIKELDEFLVFRVLLKLLIKTNTILGRK